MLYELLFPFADDFIGFNLLRFPTFRAGAALITALVIGLLLGPAVIRWLKRRQGEGQPIRDDGPETHLAKVGTPTMTAQPPYSGSFFKKSMSRMMPIFRMLYGRSGKPSPQIATSGLPSWCKYVFSPF